MFIGRPALAVHAPATHPPAESGSTLRQRRGRGPRARPHPRDLARGTHERGRRGRCRARASPSNKRQRSKGRRLYEAQRLTVLGTRTHLVEVDLVRAGEPMTVYGAERTSDYRMLVRRGDRRPRAELFLFSLRDPIPTFSLPLRPGDSEPVIDLGRVLGELYEQRAYDLGIDYRGEPVPR